MKVIFIGGYGRSGTTLLGSMLGTHPEHICTPESQFKTALLTRNFPHWKDGQLDYEAVFQEILKDWRFKLWNTKPARPEGPESYSDILEHIVMSYARAQGKAAPSVWIDHTPSNIKFPALLFELFPDSKMIHLVRDGRGVAASLLDLDWGPHTVDRVARIWKARIEMGIKAEELFGHDKLIRVRFEDLLLAPRETLEGLCESTGLEFHPDMILGSGFTVPTYTKSQHTLVGKAPNGKRASAWKEQLTARQIEIFESFAGDALARLGYELVYGTAAKPPTKPEMLFMKVEHHMKNYFRKKRLVKKRQDISSRNADL